MPMRTAARKIVASNWSSGEEYPSRTRPGAVPCATGGAVCVVARGKLVEPLEAIVRPDMSASRGLITGFDRKRVRGSNIGCQRRHAAAERADLRTCAAVPPARGTRRVCEVGALPEEP
jgi:hypothetical protein